MSLILALIGVVMVTAGWFAQSPFDREPEPREVQRASSLIAVGLGFLLLAGFSL